MLLEQISYFSQTVAAVAVVVSLIYLAIQVRQTERNQRAMMQQVRTDRGIVLSKCFSEPHMSVIWAKIMRDEPDFSREEQAQLLGYVRSLALNLLDAHALHQMKLLSDEAFERAGAGSRYFFARPRARATWELVRPQFTSRDARVVDSMVIDGVALAAAVDQAAEGKLVRDTLIAAARAPESQQEPQPPSA